MACSEESLSAWLDEELEPAEKKALALHVISCPACAQILGELMAARTCVATRSLPEKISVPRRFWRRVKRRLDEIDQLARATELALEPRPMTWLQLRPLAFLGLALVLVALGVRLFFPIQKQAGIFQLASLHMAASVSPNDPGLMQAVGFRPDSQWRALGHNVVNINGVWALQSLYAVDGIPVSVFRLPEGTLDTTRLAPVAVGRQIIYLAAEQNSSLAARHHSLGWDVVVARSTPQHIIHLCLSCPPDERLLQGEPLFMIGR